jgi:hypothetical protein
MKKHFFLLAFICALFSSALAQQANNTLQNSNPAYTKYKRIDHYIPDDNTPVKTVQLNFNIFTGPNTLHDNAEDRAKLAQLLVWVNAWYANNAAPTDPLPGVSDLPDTRIRFEVADRIYFYNDTKLENSCSVSDMEKVVRNTDPLRMNYLNVYFSFGACQQHSLTPYPAFDTYSSAAKGADLYVYMPIPVNVGYASAQTLAHELGHTLDLLHTYEPSCCHETCDALSPEYLDDVFGKEGRTKCWHDAGWSCNPTDSTNTCTNNMMGGVSTVAYYFSPKQMGKMHRALSVKSVSRYVRDCPASPQALVIDSNEVWDLDMRVYSDIIVSKGATLTIKSNISIPDNCRVLVKKDADLKIEGGRITESCSGKEAEIKRK